MFRRRQRSARRAPSAYRSPFLRGRKPLFEVLEDRRVLAVFVVDNVGDAGAGTLRDAITMANTTPNVGGVPDQIEFAIPGAGPHTIALASALPSIGESVVIDGFTEDTDGASAPNTNPIDMPINATMLIVVDGGGGAFAGFTIATAGGGSTLRGLVIQDFMGAGVSIVDSDNNVVEGNYIGTNAAGDAAAANITGVSITQTSTMNRVGGTDAADRNLISGNSGDGVSIVEATTNSVLGNFIGTEADGTTGLGNGSNGVFLNTTANGNTIGGTATEARNVIADNDARGVEIRSSSNTLVQGNFIGLDRTGNAALGNASGGVLIAGALGVATGNIIGGTVAGARNVISGNSSTGVTLTGADADGNTVQGNYIGLDVDGDTDFGNSGDGVNLNDGASGNTIGGTTEAARNIISSNSSSGVQIEDTGTSGNMVQGNYIGLGVNGTTDLGNSGDGVRILDAATSNTIGGAAAGAGNVISGNSGDGVDIRGDGTDTNTVAGNRIGTDAAGNAAVGNSDNGVQISNAAASNTIGGTAAGARNIISGNSSNGVLIFGAGTSSNTILGNYIGLDVDGDTDLGNSGDGVRIQSEAANNTVGGAAAGSRNVISGNSGDGVDIRGDGTDGIMVQGNYIGTAANGTSDLGNNGDGVQISEGSQDNSVGGTADGAGNTIAFNNDGVAVEDDDSTGNAIRRNSIFNNDEFGIDLGDNDGTPNDPDDPDEGPNRIQNFPDFIGSATLVGDSVQLRYEVDTATANASYPLFVEFFSADSNNQEGQTYLATDEYVDTEAQTTKLVVIPLSALLTSPFLIATATDSEGNTSEFSGVIEIALPTILGSEPTIILPEEEIDDSDINAYQYIAHSTGKLVVRIDFLHFFGDLDLEARDEFGNLLAMSNSSTAGQNFEQVILPVVTQERYFIYVIAVDVDNEGGQDYALEVENFPAPVPSGIHLDPASDSGMMNNDNFTSDTTPTFFIQTDVFNFVDTNNDGIYVDPDFIGPPAPPAVGHDAIDVLTAAEAQAIQDGTPLAGTESGGIAVEVTLVNTTTAQSFRFFADPLIPTDPEVYKLIIPDDLALTAGVYLVSARTKIFDGQKNDMGEPDQAMGRSNASPPLWFTIDTIKPNVFFGNANSGIDGLDASSDSGVSGQPGTFIDRVTNDTTPTLWGTAEPNAKVRVYVLNSSGDRVLIGETQASGSGGGPLAAGRWFVTSTINMNDPALGFADIDGLRHFEVEAEDSAGNISQGAGFISTDTPLPINDNTTTDFTITVNGFVGPISDLQIELNITHPDITELSVFLISPAGTQVELFSNLPGGGANFTNTIFDDAAAESITAGVAPFTGTWRPESEELIAFNNENPQGTWTLRIVDNTAGDVGTLENWSLWIESDLEIFIDTQGPQITAVTPNGSNFNLLTPKPSQDGPTPVVNSLKIALSDLPARLNQFGTINDFLYNALVASIAQSKGNYMLVGDRVGNIPIQSIAVMNLPLAAALTSVTSASQFIATSLIGATINPGDYVLFTSGENDQQVQQVASFNSTTGELVMTAPFSNVPMAGDLIRVAATEVEARTAATAMVELTFADPLPDDSYTFTVKDALVDPAGNRLDGESNVPDFPSGDGVPGGDFVVSFVVDSRPEIGAYIAKDIDIDINGNLIWDPGPVPGAPFTNVDLSFTLPVANSNGTIGKGGFGVHDLLFAGKFLPLNGNGGEMAAAVALNGAGDYRYFDQLAAFGFSSELNAFRWIIDTNSDGVVTIGTDLLIIQAQIPGFNIAGAIPVAGNFDGDISNGDENGLYYRGTWALDTDGDYVLDSLLSGNLLGQPIVGDFDGDGADDFAVFNNNQFFFDLNQDGNSDTVLTLGFPGVLDKPVAADMDQDGIDDIGLWVPRTSASPPRAVAEWYFWISDDFAGTKRISGTINTLDHAFTVIPFGSDFFAEFGDERALPIVGNFDPPASSQAGNSVAANNTAAKTTAPVTTASAPASTSSTTASTSSSAKTAQVESATTTPSTSTSPATVAKSTAVESKKVETTPAVTVAAPVQPTSQTSSTPTKSVNKSAAKSAPAPSATTEAANNTPGSASAAEKPAASVVNTAGSVTTTSTVATPTKTAPAVKTKKVSVPVVEPTVAPVASEIAKPSVTVPTTTVPTTTTSKKPVKKAAKAPTAVVAEPKPAETSIVETKAVETAPAIDSPVAVETAVAESPAVATPAVEKAVVKKAVEAAPAALQAAGVGASSATGPVQPVVAIPQVAAVSTVVVKAPVTPSSSVVVKAPAATLAKAATIQVEQPLVSVSKLAEGTTVSVASPVGFSVHTSSTLVLPAAVESVLARPTEVTTSPVASLLQTARLLQFDAAPIEAAIDELDFWAEEDLLNDLSYEAAGSLSTSNGTLSFAWQDWDLS